MNPNNKPMFRDGMFTNWSDEESWRDRNSNGDEARKIMGTLAWDMELREWSRRLANAEKIHHQERMKQSEGTFK